MSCHAPRASYRPAVSPRDKAADSGFTLVEALVATTITVALIAIALSGFVVAYNAVTRGTARSAREDAILVARQAISRDVRQASRIVVYEADSLRIWNGDGDALTYVQRDSTLFRGRAPVFPERSGSENVTLYAFEARAVSASGDTLIGAADTESDDVALIHVALRVGSARGTVAQTVDIAPRTHRAWPERDQTPAWPRRR